MKTLTDLNKIVIYTPHAELRMNQRAITEELIEFIIEYADKRAYVSKDKKGEEHHLLAKRKYRGCSAGALFHGMTLKT